jgi:cell shape-determining protein MreC
MNALLLQISKKLAWVMIICIPLMLWSCESSQTGSNNKKLEEAKQTTIQNLNKIKNDIQERISYLDEQVKEANGELQENLTEARTELINQRDILAVELENVQKASIETWNEVVSKASASLGQARSKTNEVSRKVRAWMGTE